MPLEIDDGEGENGLDLIGLLVHDIELILQLQLLPSGLLSVLIFHVNDEWALKLNLNNEDVDKKDM